MEIAVDGWRPGAAEWDAVKSLTLEQIPALSNEQREVAKQFGIPELDYARNAEAGRRSQESLLIRTEQLARLLARLLKERVASSGVESKINRVTLRTIQDRFDVEMQINGSIVPLRIEESIVDEYFDAGSVDAEQKLARIFDRALASLKQ
jgi:hypothetical protein